MPAIETLRSLIKNAGHTDPPIRKIRASNIPYDAAGYGRRAKGWAPTRLGPNQVLWTSQEAIRDRARDAVRKNAYAANAVSTWVSEAIGNGIKPQSQHPDRKVREQIHQAWNRWVDEADSTTKLNFYGLQSLAFRAMVEAGESLCRFRLRPKKKLFVPLQLQLIESDQMPIYMIEFPNVATGNTVREGIEFTPDMDIEAYHIWREHPYDTAFFTNDPLTVIRVDADEMLHLFQPLRPGQFRGQPWLTQVLVALHELDAYTDAELVRKKITAMLVGFVKKGDDQSTVFNEKPNPDANVGDPGIASLEPGTINYLLPTEDIVFSNPPADAGYAAFNSQTLHAVAAGVGLSYELLTGDLARVNYSSIRTGMLSFRRKCEQIQRHIFIQQFCLPVWKRFLLEAVMAGKLDLPGYDRDAYQYETCKWVTSGFAYIDPSKDIDAAIRSIRGGLSTRAEEVASMGRDVEAVDAEWAIDLERSNTMGLVFDSDPTKVLVGRESNPSQAPPPEEVEPTNEDTDESDQGGNDEAG